MKSIKTVHIIGMGALGTLYGSYITNALGKEAVKFVVDENRYERYLKKNVVCNGSPVSFNVIKSEDATPADLIIVAVKAPALLDALDTMKSSVGDKTIIISVMNGITSEKIIGKRFGMDNVVDCIAVGMDAMKLGDDLTYTMPGKLCIGVEAGQCPDNLNAVADFFSLAGVPYSVEADIVRRMWGKFMLNVGINQTCMVYNTSYKGVLTEGESNRTFISAMREVIAIASAEGINLTEEDLHVYVELIKTLDPDCTPSMGQDRMLHRKSEVEIFAGTVIEIAKRHNILVPVNEFLYHRVAEIESAYDTIGSSHLITNYSLNQLPHRDQ